MSKDDIILEEQAIGIDLTQDDSELTLDDFDQGNFVPSPSVGAEIILEVFKITKNPNTKGKNSQTGKEFDIGLKYKDGRVVRYDIETDQGIFTIKNWELFFKLLSSKPIGNLTEGVLRTYAKTHGKRFTGAKFSLKRLLDGGHANYKPEDLAKIRGTSLAEAKTYQDEIKLAIKESRLFEVKLVS